MSSGTYIVKAGEKFYIGSTSRLSTRKYDHLGRLRRNVHHNKKLQDAFNTIGSASFISITFIARLPNEDTTEFRDRLRAAEQAFLDSHADDPNLCNESKNARGPDTECHARRGPVSAETREKIRTAAIGRTPSIESRRKMALAKIGAANVKSRPIEISCPDGSTKRFESVTEMAKFFNVTQQTADHWVRGVCPWPGTGGRNRKANWWIAEYSIVTR